MSFKLSSLFRAMFIAGAMLAPVLHAGASQAQTAVTTWHYDNGRTGWNQAETALTQAAVGGQSGARFGLLGTVALDQQVDAQPLVVPNVKVQGDPNAGTHDVVYVVTEANTIYAIDPTRRTVLLKKSLGTPVPTPLNCTNNARVVGVTGTPVIDPVKKTLFVIAYALTKDGPIYRVHALDLATFAEKVSPTNVEATRTLVDGTTLTFNPKYQRQRAALTLVDGKLFAAFTSFCDFSPSRSRGWVIGWDALTLKPASVGAPAAPLTLLANRNAIAPRNFFLTSIWMSGAGPAADAGGNLYFATGNSAPGGATYDGVNNVEQSVVKYAIGSGAVADIFTPFNIADLDTRDQDFGSGGVMLPPPSLTALPPLALAAGKSGQMYLMNRNDLGGFTPGGPDRVLSSQNIGGCWCAPSYFGGANPYVVSSGGRSVKLWQIAASPAKLKLAASSPTLPTGQDGGFFTTVSSNKQADPIIWAVTRPASETDTTVSLYAFAALPAPKSTALATLFSAPAGQWVNPDANANIVPVVANGRVYVASDRQLAIFGLGAPAAAADRVGTAALAAPAADNAPPARVSGVIATVSGNTLVVRARTGALVSIDISAALASESAVALYAGEAVTAAGARDAAGVLRAVAVTRAKPGAAAWPADE